MDFAQIAQNVFRICQTNGVQFTFYSELVNDYNVETSESQTSPSTYTAYGFWLPPGATVYMPMVGTMVQSEFHKIVCEAISGPCPKNNDYVIVNGEKYIVTNSKDVNPTIQIPVVYVVNLDH